MMKIKKELCYDCKYLSYDSCCNGYCGNFARRKQNICNLVVDDRGCLIQSCDFFHDKSEK